MISKHSYSSWYKIGKKYFQNGIAWSLKKVKNYYNGNGINATFDMSGICLKESDEKEITISNEDFEILMAEYIKRKRLIKAINKKVD